MSKLQQSRKHNRKTHLQAAGIKKAAQLPTLTKMIGAFLIVGISITTAFAGAPRVAIDIGPTVECREVGDATAVAAHEKIVEATFHLSVLLESGLDRDLEQLRLSIESPEHRLRVVDFQPRTELSSELASNVEISSTAESSKSMSVAPSGQYGPVQIQVASGGGLGVTQNQGSKETYHRLAPKQVLVASGTTNAAHGVFFKWKKSSQVTLEGAREATCQFAVPRGWRGDWVHVRCEVLGVHRNYLGEKIEQCGQAEILVGLHLVGDRDAYRAARQLSETQGSVLASQSSSPTGVRYVANRPISEDRNTSREWFSLPAMFKLCDHSGPQASVEITDRRDREPVSKVDALMMLRQLSDE
jgi:hypothetical protein